MTWEIVMGLSGLFAFGAAVLTPLLKLNSAIIKLNCLIGDLKRNAEKSDRRLDGHDRRLDDHGLRIHDLENEARQRRGAAGR